ncbi:5-oxoprolinase subunit PxpB [Neisseria leonii]|uniref:5-oxoprolinase subunit PxpB n=1 Tax=Neisseria leonii TaxID=2995413 RepID=A0A9X4E2U9_9NEIS|nr:5-oxoprolinase subunit PxpB [Neisseria sp. 51.81]MDD9328199.1 5-oxoprolinase subunit PxpB [Neisseria sp. 51.81]
MTTEYRLTAVSENALAFMLPPPADLDRQRRLWAFADAASALAGVAETVVGMNNLTVFVHGAGRLNDTAAALEALWPKVSAADYCGRHVEIPVHYGGADGPDLGEVAAFHAISPEEVVRRHTETVYTVFMMGFQPGFPYLGGLPENLHTPRRAVPRTQVAAGSVGIGGAQTGVYPFASPGGWQIIGRTALPLFDAQKNPPTLLAAGDTVQFVAVSAEY